MRSIYSIVELLKHEYDFYIVTGNTDLGEATPYKNILSDTLFEKDGIHFYYFSQERKTKNNLLALIKTISPDLIYINSFWSYLFSIFIVRETKDLKLQIPVLLAPRGMLSPGALSIKAFKKRIYLLAAKIFALYKHIPFHATNEEEAHNIRKIFPKAKIHIASNFNTLKPLETAVPKTAGHLKLFYLGRISPVKNLKFALECLSGINPSLQIEYDIYGNLEDKNYWAECLTVINTLPPHIKVQYRQELQFNEIQTVISSYHALFLPTLNENFGHSIAESLLSGRLVLISDQTPWSEVSKFNAGYAIPLNNQSEFIKALEELAALNYEQFRTKSISAIKYISGKLQVEKNIAAYKKLFNDSQQN